MEAVEQAPPVGTGGDEASAAPHEIGELGNRRVAVVQDSEDGEVRGLEQRTVGLAVASGDRKLHPHALHGADRETLAVLADGHGDHVDPAIERVVRDMQELASPRFADNAAHDGNGGFVVLAKHLPLQGGAVVRKEAPAQLFEHPSHRIADATQRPELGLGRQVDVLFLVIEVELVATELAPEGVDREPQWLDLRPGSASGGADEDAVAAHPPEDPLDLVGDLRVVPGATTGLAAGAIEIEEGRGTTLEKTLGRSRHCSSKF